MRSHFEFRVSNFGSRFAAMLALLLVVAMGLAFPDSLAAQGCAMCYTSAAAAKAEAIQALRDGILILLLPVVVMSGAIAVVVFRRRNEANEAEGWSEEQERELSDMLARVEPVGRPERNAHEVEFHSPVS